MRNDFAGDVDLHSANTRYAFELVNHLLLDRLYHAFCGVTEHDVQRHIIAVDVDVACFIAGYIIPAGAKIGNLLKGGLYLLFGDSHFLHSPYLRAQTTRDINKYRAQESRNVTLRGNLRQGIWQPHSAFSLIYVK